MKKFSYNHPEANAAGELKNGIIKLIKDETLVIGVLSQDDLYEKTVSSMVECKARGIYQVRLTTCGYYAIEDIEDYVSYIPKQEDLM